MNEMTRRDFLRLSAMLAAGGIVTACTPQPPAAPATSPAAPATSKPVPTEAKKVELTAFWRTNPKEIETMEKAFAAFKNANPGTSINFIQAAGNVEGDAKLQTLFAANTPPHLFASVFAAGLMDYVYKDMVTDLTPYIEKDKYDQSDFQSSAVQTFTFGKKQFGVPRGGIPTGIFYNKDLFDKAGLPYPPSDWEDPSWTWDKMLEYAKKLTLDTNGDGKIDQWGISLQFQHHGSLPLIWGKQIFPDDAFKYGITTQHFFRDPVVVNAYQQAADLIHKHKVNPAADITKDLGFFGPFMSGQVAMYGNLCAYVQPSTAKFKWSVAAVPRGAPTIQQKSLTFTGPFLVGKGCSNPDMAWELVKYLTSGEGQKTIAQGAVVGTSRKSLTDWWLGQFGAPAKDLATVQAGGYKYGIESPNVRIVQWGEILSLINAEFDPMWLGEKSAQQCSDSLSPKLDQLLAKIYNGNKETAKKIFPDFSG